jgi:N-methylhydantoinase A/oxoprolinase/acetone carboxylase beta subunit
MRIGIDIGGTHTDSVLINGTRLIAAAKAPTNHENLLESINQVLHTILAGQDAARVEILNLSTTLSTNAIVTGKTDAVGVLVAAGPGIAPETYRIGDYFHVIPGSLDHLGTETAPLDEAALEDAIDSCLGQGVKCFAVAAKFSPRNPVSENQMRQHLGERADFISSGHLVSGQLNFGRRIHTAYYNSAVWKTFRSFSSALTASLRGFALQSAEINILKADGGTMPLARALEAPVQSIFSGPAASVMGILATTQTGSDLIMLDIGGTTTDIALFASGQPLLEREGIAINNHPTLVRAIQVESIGIGGDSLISIGQTGVRTGPHRLGPCLANGGPAATLMDAFNVLDLAQLGDVTCSRDGLESLAAGHAMSSRQLAAEAVDFAVNAIATKIEDLIALVNSKPVYTIHEMLEEREISPQKIIVIGGPAPVFHQLLQARLGMDVVIPPLHGVANAIGAALTRTTSHLTLTADTAKGKVSAPMLGIFRSIPRGYTLDTAVEEARNLLATDLEQAGVPIPAEEIQITQADSFNMVEGSYTSGRNIRVVAQVQPAVIARLDTDSAVDVRIAATH